MSVFKEQFYNSLFLHNPNGSYLVDLSGKFIDFNDEIMKLTGYSKQELMAMPNFLPFFKEEDKSFITEKFRKTVSGEKHSFNTTILTKNNIEKDLRVTCAPVIIENVIHGSIGVVEDITDQRARRRESKQELIVAKNTQCGILPEPIEESLIQIEGIYIPSKMLSGDMYCFSKISEDRYVVCMSDVMGHGVTASLIAMAFISHLRGILVSTSDPAYVMQELNNHIINLFNTNSDSSTYITAIFLLIDVKTKQIEYINAGHPSGMMVTEDTSIMLESENFPLGISNDVILEKKKITYTGKARIVLYTDGLFESVKKSPSKFLDTLENDVKKHFTDNNHVFTSHVRKIIDCLSDKNDDDISFLSITVN